MLRKAQMQCGDQQGILDQSSPLGILVVLGGDQDAVSLLYGKVTVTDQWLDICNVGFIGLFARRRHFGSDTSRVRMGNLLGNESGKLTSLMTPRLTHDGLAPAHDMAHIQEAASRLFWSGHALLTGWP
jgi:hypothetical protein